ncbi:protein SICKLE-like [Impatiens glandulifera]|uniref:protein SICKLE-like n=1 Tax=Impatiens glandulifera TaxID=253017 RepID=UPI001FB17D7D|nr:protein SICKLE-like [Impatiens glandulifera]XP_047332571.1 protein SICKLE-like [Impatiens glandulifera]
MDESVKRRERLKAMRSEASSSLGDDGVPLHDIANSASPSALCNPLLNPTSTQQIHEDSNSNSNSSSRFDYYTDPLSAFSSTKRSKQDSQISFAPPPRPSPPYMPPSGPPYSPNFGMPQMRGPFFPPPQQQQYGIPPGMRSPYQGGTPGYHHGPMNPVRGNSFSPYPVQGRGPWNNRIPFSGTGYRGNRPSPNMGRGQGRYGNFVRPGGGRGGWTGPGNQSAEVAPGLYFEKSSVDDPWKMLTPITWKGGKGLTPITWKGGKGLIMESPRISMVKKNETTSTGPSLAELLAETFKEAAADDKETSKD